MNHTAPPQHPRLSLGIPRFAALVITVGSFAFLSATNAALAPPTFTPAGGPVKAPTAITISNPNAGGNIFYTFDGTDPRDVFGHVSPNSYGYDEPLVVNRPLQIRARIKSAGEWSPAAAAAFTPDQDFSALLFTEIMYHPQDSGDLAEFVELKNIGTKPLDLTGLQFAGDDPSVTAFYFFAKGTVIRPGEFLVLVSHAATFQQTYPGVAFHGRFTGHIRNSAARLCLRTEFQLEVVSASFSSSSPWPVVPDNHGYFPQDVVGFSLVRWNYDPAVDPHTAGAWRASAYRMGSPGADDPPPVVPPIYVNELLTRSATGAPDAVELFNPNPFSVDVSKWWLSDERNDPPRHSIPAGTVIPPLGYLVVDETQFGAGPRGFAFSADGERCYLFSADANGILTGYSHGLQFPASERDVTFGRHVASDGAEDFPPQVTSSFGSTNAGPRISPVVVSEVMYHPPHGELEYIEIENTSDEAVALWDPENPQNRWIIGPQVMPSDTILPAHSRLLLVEGVPDTFRTRYQVPLDTQIYSLNAPLSDAGTMVAILRPSGIVSDGTPRLIEMDKVVFTDRDPWPPGADGQASLERIDLKGWGNDPRNWRLSPTGNSPGRPNSGNLPPAVWAGNDRTEFIGRATPLPCALLDEASLGAGLTAAWTQLSGPASVEFTGPTPTQTTTVFSSPGAYVLRLTANDGTFTTSATVTIDVIEPPFASWQANAFTPVELDDPATSGASADPDRDGRTNLAEYFFDSPPKLSDHDPFVVELAAGHLQIRWTQRRETPDLDALPERADRMEGSWFSAPELFDCTVIDLGATREVIVRDRLPISSRPAGFLRLRLKER